MNLGPIKDKSVKGKRSLPKLLGRQGLYAVALICIAVIGIVAALSLSDKGDNDLAGSPTPTPGRTQSAELTIPPATEIPVGGGADVEDEEVILHNPVKNTKISTGYAMDILVYSDTLKEWTTHNGIDIPADEGADVFSVLDGTVESASSDALTGNTIVIAHENGLKSIYCGLKSIESNLKTGTKVLRGQVIGKVGNTAINEVEEGHHLHFALMKGDNYVNPEDYLSNYSK